MKVSWWHRNVKVIKEFGCDLWIIVRKWKRYRGLCVPVHADPAKFSCQTEDDTPSILHCQDASAYPAIDNNTTTHVNTFSFTLKSLSHLKFISKFYFKIKISKFLFWK